MLFYALNALGNTVDPVAFRDVTDFKKLRLIGPNDVTALHGYATYFPQVRAEWSRRDALLETLDAQHSVSKHRRSIYTGGQMRLDEPPGFFEALGITDAAHKSLFRPHEEIILMHDPRQTGKPTPTSRAGYELLETFAPSFVSFVNTVSRFALADAKATVTLTETAFRK